MDVKKKILVVDDEPKIVEIVKAYLEKNGFDVIDSNNGKSAVELFDKENPSLVILDLMLPGLSGEQVCQNIRKKSRVPIIMLTAKVQEANIINGLNIGADGYMIKPFSPNELIARVTALLRRTDNEVIPLSNIFEFNNLDLVIDALKHEVKKSGKIVKLTPKEYKLLLVLIKYPNKLFTRDELILIAFGNDYDSFDRVIDTHIKNLRQKIEDDHKNPKYIITVHGLGYRFGGDILEV